MSEDESDISDTSLSQIPRIEHWIRLKLESFRLKAINEKLKEIETELNEKMDHVEEAIKVKENFNDFISFSDLKIRNPLDFVCDIIA